MASKRLLGCALGAMVLGGVGYGASSLLPTLGAGGLLHPIRRQVTLAPPPACANATFAGVGVELEGWRCQASGQRRGTLLYLHGIADNRESAVGVIERFARAGFEVIAYDSRAHGGSSGDVCTYGYFEKHDLHRVMGVVAPGPIVLVGTSLGAAVALQGAAADPRVTAVVAAETFSDLRTVASERAPFFFSRAAIDRAFALAERQAGFDVDLVSPLAAAAQVTAPVLLIHGVDDVDTPAEHSRRVFAALRGPKRLMLVPNAGHNRSLRGDVWEAVESWVDEVLAQRPRLL